MKLNIIIFKNLVIHAFTTPNFTEVEPEKAAKGLERSIIANFESKPEVVKPYENLDMYYVGLFDDETGVIEPADSPVLLFSPRELIMKLNAEAIAKAKKLIEEQKAEVPAV